jgi:MOSC domain-containing protein YiiM
MRSEKGDRPMRDSVGVVIAVSSDDAHRFSKPNRDHIRLLAGLGVEGDAHLGPTVQHQTRVRSNPNQPNLRQVHLIQSELFDELRPAGFDLVPGELGENVTTRGLNLLGLPTGARLRLGATAVVLVTGLRNPCRQMNAHQEGLMAAVLDRDEDGNLIRKAGVMGVVLADGEVRAGDPIVVDLPRAPHVALRPL